MSFLSVSMTTNRTVDSRSGQVCIKCSIPASNYGLLRLSCSGAEFEPSAQDRFAMSLPFCIFVVAKEHPRNMATSLTRLVAYRHLQRSSLFLVCCASLITRTYMSPLLGLHFHITRSIAMSSSAAT